MINVFIWGTGDFRSKVESIINSKNINTIAYIDNKKEMQGKFINDKTIINPNKINEYKYDYILIASQYYKEIHDQLIYLGINEKKIINSFKFIEDITIIEYMKSDKEYLYNKFEDNYNNAQNSMHIDSIITGLSYAECGIDLNTLKNKALNFALSGQDIYYDYNIAKNVIEGTKNKIKNVIIGLSYYSFQYDLSLSKSKTRCEYVYKDILNLVHNYKKSNDPKAELLDYINQPIRINEKIFLRDLNVIIRRLKINCKIDFDEIWRKQFGKLEMEKKIEEGKKLAMMDSNKNYPDTVSENKKILFNYIKFLNDRNIKVYIVVFPVTKYYSRYFCAILKEEFYNIMEELNKKCEFTCIDYFDSNEFSDEEFSDSSHLNICGAKKFTKILNEII